MADVMKEQLQLIKGAENAENRDNVLLMCLHRMFVNNDIENYLVLAACRLEIEGIEWVLNSAQTTLVVNPLIFRVCEDAWRFILFRLFPQFMRNACGTCFCEYRHTLVYRIRLGATLRAFIVAFVEDKVVDRNLPCFAPYEVKATCDAFTVTVPYGTLSFTRAQILAVLPDDLVRAMYDKVDAEIDDRGARFMQNMPMLFDVRSEDTAEDVEPHTTHLQAWDALIMNQKHEQAAQLREMFATDEFDARNCLDLSFTDHAYGATLDGWKELTKLVKLTPEHLFSIAQNNRNQDVQEWATSELKKRESEAAEVLVSKTKKRKRGRRRKSMSTQTTKRVKSL